jgi:hypothetical protein
MFQVDVGDDMVPIAVDFHAARFYLAIVAVRQRNADVPRGWEADASEVQTYSFLLPEDAT